MSVGNVLSQISEATRLKADPILGGTLTISGNGGLSLESGATFTLAGTGATSFGGAVTITGAATLSSTLAVTGASTFTGAVTHSSTTTLSDTVTIADAKNVVLDTTTGTKIGTAVGQKLGFWNATPVVQQASANQAALTNSTGGTGDGTLSAVGVTNTGDRSADINNNFTELYTLITAIRSALVATGIIKGAA